MTAAPKYVSGSWKPSTATSKPFLEGVVATKISPTYCSRRSAWRSQKQNLSFFRKRLKMQAPSNSCAEPNSLANISKYKQYKRLRSLRSLVDARVHRHHQIHSPSVLCDSVRTESSRGCG